MKLKDALDYISTDYDFFIHTMIKEYTKGEDETEEQQIEFVKLSYPIVILLSIGAGSLSGFSHLQDLLSGLRIITELNDDETIKNRKLLLIPEIVRLKGRLRDTHVFKNNTNTNVVKDPSIRAYIQYPDIKEDNEYFHTRYEPKIYILAVDPEFANPTMVGHSEVSPIQYTAKQLDLVIQRDNSSVARGMYKSRSIVCCYIEEPIFSEYGASFFSEGNVRSSNIRHGLQEKAKEFYKRVRAEKTFAFSEECLPKDGFILNQFASFLTETVLPNKGFIILDNKAHWHVNNRYHDNYFFETMCEIPYMFTHPPFDTYQDYIYWWYPYYPSVVDISRARSPPLRSIEELAHFIDGIRQSIQAGGRKRRSTLRKQRGSRRGQSRHRRNR